MALGLLTLFYAAGGLVGVLVCAFLLYTAYVAYVHWKYRHFPSPERPSFYFGHLYDIWKLQKEIYKEVSFPAIVDYWLGKVESPIFVVFFGHQPIIVCLDPEVIKVVCMNKNNSKSLTWEYTHTAFGTRLIGRGIVSERFYENWKPRRAFYDPAFKKAYLNGLIGTFNEITASVIDELKPMADGKTLIPIKQHINDFTLNVISKIGFGTDFSKQWTAESLGVAMPKGLSHNNVMYYILEQTLKAMHKNLITSFPSLNQYLYPSEAKVYRTCIEAMRKIGKDCIMKRIKMIEAGEEVPQDIISCILQFSTEKPNIEDLVDDFVTFYAAGQDTTANTLLFCLVLLAQHPNAMERLQQEIEEVLGNRKVVTSEDVEKLQYTDQVINEALRLYPVADGVVKNMEKTTVIGKYSYPAGAEIFMAFPNIARLPQYFDDPDTFNPDRFHPDNKKPNSFVYFPFGIGHRACIGKPLAKMEMKITLARLMQTFHIQLPADYKLQVVQRFTLQPKGDLHCIMTCK